MFEAVLRTFEKRIFLKFWNFKIIFFTKTTLSLSVRWWMCIRTCERAIMPYLLQKTTRNQQIFKLSSKKRVTRKTSNVYLHPLQAQADPRSTLCNWLLNSQFKNENPQSLKRPAICVQSEMVVPLWSQRKQLLKVMLLLVLQPSRR